jgi:large subunit ribosomal protein L21
MSQKTKQSGASTDSPKKAVIAAGGKQYLVAEGDELEVELLKTDKKADKNVVFEPLLLIEGPKTTVGTPVIGGAQVKAAVIEPEVKADKVTAIRFKAKKRVHKRRGHRQRHSRIKITKITT